MLQDMLKQIVQNIIAFDKTKCSIHFAYRTYSSSTQPDSPLLVVPFLKDWCITKRDLKDWCITKELALDRRE
jgi:hypothetical protein